MNKVNGSYKRQEIIDEHSKDLADTTGKIRQSRRRR